MRQGAALMGAVTKEPVVHVWRLPAFAEGNKVFAKEVSALSRSVSNHHCHNLGIASHTGMLKVGLELLC